jgi:hypothetical protein
MACNQQKVTHFLVVEGMIGLDWIGSIVHEKVTSAVKIVKFPRDKVLDVTRAVYFSDVKF